MNRSFFGADYPSAPGDPGLFDSGDDPEPFELKIEALESVGPSVNGDEAVGVGGRSGYRLGELGAFHVQDITRVSRGTQIERLSISTYLLSTEIGSYPQFRSKGLRGFGMGGSGLEGVDWILRRSRGLSGDLRKSTKSEQIEQSVIAGRTSERGATVARDPLLLMAFVVSGQSGDAGDYSSD